MQHSRVRPHNLLVHVNCCVNYVPVMNLELNCDWLQRDKKLSLHTAMEELPGPLALELDMSIGNVKHLDCSQNKMQKWSLFRFSMCQAMYMEIRWIPKSSTPKDASDFFLSLFLSFLKMMGDLGVCAWLIKLMAAVSLSPSGHCAHIPHSSKGWAWRDGLLLSN